MSSKPDISARIPYNHLASRTGATGFDRGRNVRRDACRAVSVGLVIKLQGNTIANSNELALAAYLASERLCRKLLMRAAGDVTLDELAQLFGP